MIRQQFDEKKEKNVDENNEMKSHSTECCSAVSQWNFVCVFVRVSMRAYNIMKKFIIATKKEQQSHVIARKLVEVFASFILFYGWIYCDNSMNRVAKKQSKVKDAQSREHFSGDFPLNAASSKE